MTTTHSTPPHPRIALPESSRHDLESTAAELLHSFREVDDSLLASPWQPERIPKHILTEKELVGPLVMERPNQNTFIIEEIRVILADRQYVLDLLGCQLLDRLAERWSTHPSLLGLSTMALMRDRLKAWCFGVLESHEFSPSVDAILSQLNQDIRQHEVWIGLSDIDVQHPFMMGNVEIRGIDAAQVEMCLQALTETHIDDPERNAAKRLLEQDWQGHTVAIYRGLGDRSAVEALAVEHAERACSFLRMIEPCNQSAIQRSYLQPLTFASQFGVRNLLFNPIEKHSTWSRSSVCNPPCGITITNERFPSQWEEGSLRNLHELLSADQPTAFQVRLIRAILVYSRHRLSPDPVEKIIFAVAGIETMLLADSDNRGIRYTLRRRLCALLAVDLDQRRALQSDIDHAYRRRSEFLHHGCGIDDRRHVESFLSYAWSYFIFAINRHTRWASLQDHHSELDTKYEAKFGGANTQSEDSH